MGPRTGQRTRQVVGLIAEEADHVEAELGVVLELRRELATAGGRCPRTSTLRRLWPRRRADPNAARSATRVAMVAASRATKNTIR